MSSSSNRIGQQGFAAQHHTFMQQGSIVHHVTDVHHAPIATSQHEQHHSSTTHHQNEKIQTYKQQQIFSNQYRSQHETHQQQQREEQSHTPSDRHQVYQRDEVQQNTDQHQMTQLSSEKNITKDIDSEDANGPESLNRHCLICNTRLWVLSNGTNNGVYDLFAEKTRTSHRRLRAVAILEGIVKEELVYADVPLHSTIICKRCFNLINEIDEIEVNLVEKREDLSSSYYKTKAHVNKDPLEVPIKKEPETVVLVSTASSGRNKVKPGKVMFDVRSGMLVMQKAEENDEKPEPTKKVSTVRNNKNNSNNSDDDDGDDDVPVDDNGPPDYDTDEAIHKEEDDQKESVICRLCDTSFKSVPHLNKHMKSHYASSYHCHYCEVIFDKAADLQTHMDQHINRNAGKIKIVKEEKVSAKSNEKASDKPIKKKPRVPKVIDCPICGKIFPRRKELQDHRRVHTGEKPFQCDICGTSFSQKGNLLMHKRITHLQEKRFKCDICDKAFKWKRLLVGHVMSIHTGERPYKCEHCEAAFVYPQHYKKHLRIHTGEKPFVCDICGKTFNCSNNCNAHMFTHTDKKQFECLLCGAGFMRKIQILDHLKTHGHTQDQNQYFKVNTPGNVLQGMGLSGAARTAAVSEHGKAAISRPTVAKSMRVSAIGEGKHLKKHHIRTNAQVLTTVSELEYRAGSMPHSTIAAHVVLPASAHGNTVNVPTTIMLPADHNTPHARSNGNNNMEIYDMPMIFIDSENNTRQVNTEMVSGHFIETGGEQVVSQHYATMQHSKDHW